MSAREDLDAAIELYHRTAADFIRGEVVGALQALLLAYHRHQLGKSVQARREKPPVEADETITQAATYWREGE